MDNHENTDTKESKRSLSFFASGLMLGVLLSTVGFGLFLRSQKTQSETRSWPEAGAGHSNGWF